MRPKLKIAGPGTVDEVKAAFDRETDVLLFARALNPLKTPWRNPEVNRMLSDY
jgi:hypothetical protein